MAKFEDLATKVEDLVELAKAIGAESKSLREAVEAPELADDQKDGLRGRVEALQHALKDAAAAVGVPEEKAEPAEPEVKRSHHAHVSKADKE